MVIEIKSNVLRALLNKAANVLGGTKDITPIVKNFLLEVTEGGISIVATDLSLSVIAKTDLVRTEGTGRALLPQMFADVVKEAPDDVLRASFTDKQATINCGSAEWTIKLMDALEFPAIPTATAIVQRFDRAAFTAALAKVKPAMSSTTNRQNLRIVDISGGKVRACDGARLHQVTVESLGQLNMQVPAAAVDDLVKLLAAPDVADVREIGFGCTEQLLVFQIHNEISIK